MMKDINGNEIQAGQRIRHTGHGETYRVFEGLILVPETARYNGPFVLTDTRAGKAEVVDNCTSGVN